MNKSPPTADNRINSLVDGELDIAESKIVLGEIENNSELQRELCDTHRIKDMMKMAYPEMSHNNKIYSDSRKGLYSTIAASIILLVGSFFSGFYFNKNSASQPFLLSQATTQEYKLVLFIGSSDDQKFEQTLNKAEEFLKKHNGKHVKVNIVASSGGINLLRISHSKFLPRIHELSKTYDALDFVACNSTIAKLKNEGKSAEIINEALVSPSAVQFVVKRLQQGWAYVAI